MKRIAALADRQLVDVGGRRDEPDVGVTSRSTPSSASSQRSRYSTRARRAASTSPSVTCEAALELAADVVAVRVRVLGEEAAVDVRDLAHEEPVLGRGEREVDAAAAAETARPPPRRVRGRAGRRRRATRRRPRAPRATRAGSAREAGHERLHQLDAAVDGRRHRPDVVVARCEREAAVGRHEVEGRLEADDRRTRRRGSGSSRPSRCRARARRRPRRSPPPSRRSSRRRAGPARAGSGRCRSAGSATRCRRRTRAGSSCRRRRSRPPRAAAPPRRSAAGTCSAKRIDPYVVTRPAVSSRSFTATGTPVRGRSGRASQTPSGAVTAPTLLAVLLRLRLGLRLRLRLSRSGFAFACRLRRSLWCAIDTVRRHGLALCDAVRARPASA